MIGKELRNSQQSIYQIYLHYGKAAPVNAEENKDNAE